MGAGILTIFDIGNEGNEKDGTDDNPPSRYK